MKKLAYNNYAVFTMCNELTLWYMVTKLKGFTDLYKM